MTHGRSAGGRSVLLALVLVLAMAPGAAASPVPDQLDPPAPGEGTPLRNPSDP